MQYSTNITICNFNNQLKSEAVFTSKLFGEHHNNTGDIHRMDLTLDYTLFSEFWENEKSLFVWRRHVKARAQLEFHGPTSNGNVLLAHCMPCLKVGYLPGCGDVWRNLKEEKWYHVYTCTIIVFTQQFLGNKLNKQHIWLHARKKCDDKLKPRLKLHAFICIH